MDLQVKEKLRGFTGRYRVIKAKLEKPEHFELNDQITKCRNELGTVQATIAEKRKKVGFVAWLTYWKTQKEVVALVKLQQRLSEEMIGMTRQLNRICKTEVVFADNIVPTVGRTMIANNLTDATPTNSMLINYAALGSDGTTPANGDTTLGTEVYRNVIASLTNANNIAYATAFFNATETSGTYAEAGIFSDATATTDSGILLSHVLISVTKSTSETLTIDWELTIT